MVINHVDGDPRGLQIFNIELNRFLDDVHSPREYKRGLFTCGVVKNYASIGCSNIASGLSLTRNGSKAVTVTMKRPTCKRISGLKRVL